MLRLITFLEEATGTELTLPMTPPSYQWDHSAAIETVTVDQLGDLNFFGGKKLGRTTLKDCILPAQAYPSLSPGAGTNPWVYLEQLEKWCDAGAALRWMVSGTPVNAAVLIEGVVFREQDGTNDLYVDITLRQYQRPGTPTIPASGSAVADATRPAETGVSTAKSYTVERGDTLSGIARTFYGDASLAWRLAAANGVVNANLIQTGRTLSLPPKDQLPAAGEKPRSVRAAEATKTTRSQEKVWVIQKKKEDALFG